MSTKPAEPAPPARPAAPLIVGAGPTGLSTALQLARAGIFPRIIDEAAEPASQSRALLVNHHSLDLLEASGASDLLLEHGNRILGLKLTINGRPAGRLSMEGMPHPYPFLLIIPQDRTERILEAALKALGIHVERKTKFIGLKLDQAGADVQMQTGSARETMRASWVIGADGAHSMVRQAIGIDFPGTREAHPWSLADIALGEAAESDHVEIVLKTGAPVLARFPLGQGRHRVISNAPDLLSRLPPEWDLGEVGWSSDFTVSYRMVERRLVGRAVLVGDAAHIHSPAGGRGMNLGIEDGVTLAELIAKSPNIEAGMLTKAMENEQKLRLRQWEAERLERARFTLTLSHRLQNFVADTSWLKLALLPLGLGAVSAVPSLKRDFLARLAGLDGKATG